MSTNILILMLVVIPSCLAVLLGIADSRTSPVLLFQCRRCDRGFRRKAYLPFARTCPLCHARDWNLRRSP